MIVLDRLSVRSGAFHLAEASLQLDAGEYAVLMGPSGSGKTTLLEAICGLRRPSGGRVVLNGVDVTHLPPGMRNIGFVPQDTALFSTMPVRENLAYGLRVRGASRAEIEARVLEVADLLRVGHLLDRRPAGLSGGEARRVAIGRAIACRTDVLLLDEPLSGLDDGTRAEVYAALDSVRSATSAAVIHVSHDHRDARRLATRRLKLESGVLSGGAVDPATRRPVADRSAGSPPARVPIARSSAS